MKDDNRRSEFLKGVVTRRTMLRGMAGAAALGAAWPVGNLASAAALKGRIKQSVCLWCYGKYMDGPR